MRDRIELWARPLRYPFLIAGAIIFILTNLKAFLENQIGMWVFMGSGILWVLATAYIEIREERRIIGGYLQQR